MWAVPAEQQTGRGGAVCKLEQSYDVRSGSKPEAKTYFNVLNLRKNIKKPRLRRPRAAQSGVGQLR